MSKVLDKISPGTASCAYAPSCAQKSIIAATITVTALMMKPFKQKKKT